MSTERYASVDNLTPILTKIETKLQNRYTKAETDSALSNKVNTSSVGAASGVAGLDSNGKVPSSQLPSYVDDVLEYNNKSSFPSTGESGKIYIAKDTNKTFRWSGTAYVEISESLALGETSSTAYAGDKGKANADHIGTMSNLETTEKGSLVEAINELKNSVSDGKATVATAITNQGVQTSSTASFSTMATNIGGILAANPGSVTPDTQITSGTSDSFKVTPVGSDFTPGYISSVSDGPKRTFTLSSSGSTVTVKAGTTTVGQKSIANGSATPSVNVASGSTDTITITPTASVGTAGYISSISNGTNKTLSMSASGATVTVKDGSTTVGQKSVSSGSVTSNVSIIDGISSSITITPRMTFSAGYISSKGSETEKTVYLVVDDNTVRCLDKNSLNTAEHQYGYVTVNDGSATPSVSVASGSTTTISITPTATVNTEGWISSISNGTDTKLYLRQSGSYVYVSSSSSGGTNYGRITKTAGSATPNISITSGTTSFTITPKATVDTAGHISSISDGTASTVYLLKNGDSVYASSSSTYSSSNNYAKYDISTETKTVKASKSSSGGSDTYTPSSGKYFSSFTVKRWQSMGFIAWSFGTYGSGTGGPYYYCNEEYGNSSLYRSISNNAGCIYCSGKCAVRRESNYFYMMMATSGHTAGTIRVGLIDFNPNQLNYSDAGDAAVYYTEIARRVSSSFGIIQLPLLATYTNNTTSNGKTWKTGTDRGTSISIGEDTPLYPFVVTNTDFAGTVMVFCGFSEM